MSGSRKYRLFDELATQLRSIAPALIGVVACPVCLRLFTKDDYNAGRLTNGHIVPKALGAKPLTLLCRACNGHTSKRERDLVEFARVFFGALPGTYVKAVEIVVGDEVVTGSLHRNEPNAPDPYTIKLRPRRGNIGALLRVAEYLRPYGDKKIAIRWGFSHQNVKLALLTSAYLESFRIRGYWYILNSNLDPIRCAILGTGADKLVDRAVRDWQIGSPLRGALTLVSLPQETQCFVFSMFGKTVILPKAEDRRCRVHEVTAKYVRAPFEELHSIDARVREGRVDLVALAGAVEQVVSFAHPDVATVRRLDPTLPLDLSWVANAPIWAAPLIVPPTSQSRAANGT